MATVSQMQFKLTNSLSSDGFEISGEVQVIPFTLCDQIAKTDRLLLKVTLHPAGTHFRGPKDLLYPS